MNNPKAVIGTNSWGSATYEKIIRGSVVDNDTLKEAMKAAIKAAVKSNLDREWEKNGLLSWCRENGVQFWICKSVTSNA